MTISRSGGPPEWNREIRAWFKWQGLSALSLVAAIAILLTVTKVVPGFGLVGLVLLVATFPLAVVGFRHLLAATRIEREAGGRRRDEWGEKQEVGDK